MNNYIGTEKIKKGTVLRIEGHIGNIELVNQDSWRVDTRRLAELEHTLRCYHIFSSSGFFLFSSECELTLILFHLIFQTFALRERLNNKTMKT